MSRITVAGVSEGCHHRPQQVCGHAHHVDHALAGQASDAVRTRLSLEPAQREPSDVITQALEERAGEADRHPIAGSLGAVSDNRIDGKRPARRAGPSPGRVHVACQQRTEHRHQQREARAEQHGLRDQAAQVAPERALRLRPGDREKRADHHAPADGAWSAASLVRQRRA